jgi:hypothetical protein
MAAVGGDSCGSAEFVVGSGQCPDQGAGSGIQLEQGSAIARADRPGIAAILRDPLDSPRASSSEHVDAGQACGAGTGGLTVTALVLAGARTAWPARSGLGRVT